MKKKSKTHEVVENEIIEQEKIRELEEFYTTNQVSNMLDKIEEKKLEIVQDMVEYANTHKKECKWDRDGYPIEYKVDYNPLVIGNKFFKPIIALASIEPEYNAEKLSLVFDYYCYLITEVNDKIGYFPSSLTSFCKLAGITRQGLAKYKNSSDLNMRIIVEKIYDQIGDTNLTMSQLKMVNERSTLFKLRAQHEMVEKEQPKVSINIIDKPDFERINQRIAKYNSFTSEKEQKND